MDVDEMILQFRNSVDDQLDPDYELQLANNAKNNIEMMRDWQKLKKEQAYTITAGQSYLNTQALPARFLMDIKFWGDDDTPWGKVDFEDRNARINGSEGYFLDLANDAIGFAGTNLPGITGYLIFTQGTVDLATGDTWAFPVTYHAIIPIEMAKIYYAANAGEKTRAWDDRWTLEYNRILSSMEVWDDRLKIKNRSAGRSSNRENSVDLRR